MAKYAINDDTNFRKGDIGMNTGTVNFLMLKNVLVSSLAIAEVICFSTYLKFKDSPAARG